MKEHPASPTLYELWFVLSDHVQHFTGRRLPAVVIHAVDESLRQVNRQKRLLVSCHAIDYVMATLNYHVLHQPNGFWNGDFFIHADTSERSDRFAIISRTDILIFHISFPL